MTAGGHYRSAMTMKETQVSPVPSIWTLPDAITQRIGATVGRQRAMAADGHLLLLLHAVPGDDDTERKGVLVWRDPKGVWRGTERGTGPDLVHGLLEQYDAAIDAVEAESEAADSAHDWFEVIQKVGPLHRAARNLHAALQTARVAMPDVRALIVLRDVADVVERAAELLSEEVEQGLRFALARQAEAQAAAAREMNRSAHRLNALMALCLPLTAVSGMFGMNLQMGIQPGPWAFWLAAGMALGLGLYVWRKFSKSVSKSVAAK